GEIYRPPHRPGQSQVQAKRHHPRTLRVHLLHGRRRNARLLETPRRPHGRTPAPRSHRANPRLQDGRTVLACQTRQLLSASTLDATLTVHTMYNDSSPSPADDEEPGRYDGAKQIALFHRDYHAA